MTNQPADMSRREFREWRDKHSSHKTPEVPTSPPAATPAPRPTDSTDDHPLTILTVCTGNICRSPMAEVLLRARLESLGIRVHSAGTHALVGHEMTGPAQELAVELGAKPEDAAAHTARYLVEPMLQDADLILTMTREHRTHAVQLVPRTLRRTFTVREFARLASTLSTQAARATADAEGDDPRARLSAAILAVGEQRGMSAGGQEDDDVVDPYRRSREVYEESASQLNPALDEVERILRAALVQ
ncbi:protein tyrosine phosphatase [Microbacterium sp. CH12i]|uniref:arsenate reductase/protein-tyrosine-phosphatase family protein n=1 Tax=Microbacterium sp. CH12i TaxID=1479651 RepID=UPI000460D3BC|nr:low molecular weight phosphatase family protein [Microbacterium sp. CH12i]KDA04899.1 protein tyrosine phosphatase [Microbacterium sp. CH12i]